MIEEEINEAIIQMENRGYEYFADNDNGVFFYDDDKNEHRFDSWDDVEHYIEMHEVND